MVSLNTLSLPFILEESGMNTGIFEIKTNGALIETVTDASITITATDSGIPPLSTDVIIMLDIVQENVHAPVFQQAEYDFSVLEHSPLGTIIDQVVADDVDVGSYLEYEITTFGSFPFSISGGDIIVSDDLDREDVGSYTFEVTATDNGAPPSGQKTDTCTVNIDIIDINDNAPIFTSDSMEMHFPENTAQYDPMLITVTDADSNDNGAVTTFQLDQYNDIFDIETLGLQNGQVSLSPKSELDRELQESYQIILSATDSGIPPQSSTLNITVVVDDENDSPPEVEQSTGQLFVPQTTPVNSEVYQIVATDADMEHNGIGEKLHV